MSSSPPRRLSAEQQTELAHQGRAVMHLWRNGQRDEAIELAKRTNVLAEQYLGSQHPFLVGGYSSLARLYYETDKLAVPVANQIRTYWWCSPPRTGRQRMLPARSTARETGASFSKDRCVRTSL